MESLTRTFDYYPFHDIQLAQYGQEDCAPGHSFGPYIRDIFLLHFVTEGTGTFTIAGRTYHLNKGELFFIPPDLLTFYQADIATPWSYTWIGFRGIVLPGLLRSTGLSKDTPTLAYSDALLKTLNKVILHGEQDGFDSPKTMGYIYFFIHELIKCGNVKRHTPSSQHAYTEAAVKYINQNIYDRISVSKLAGQLGIDRSYFCSLFKKQLGVSPQQYILHLKTEKAKAFLETTAVDVKYIADSLGYGDLYTFSHSFKKQTGLSPREWRQAHGETSA